MKVFTIGFTKKTAKDFFERLRKNKITELIDIRLNNQSQLAGFAKGKDLKYFLEEFLNIKYTYDESLTPTKDILDGYKKKQITWQEYEEKYIELLEKRLIKEKYKNIDLSNVCFLCSEDKPDYCHRRLCVEYLNNNRFDKYEIIHL